MFSPILPLCRGNRMRHSLAWLPAIALTPVILFTSLQPAHAKDTRRQFPDTVQELIQQPSVGPKKGLSPVTSPSTKTKATKAQTPDTKTKATELDTIDLMAGFSSHPLTGAPRLILPIDVAPGVSFSPKIAMQYLGNIDTGIPSEQWSLAGALPITECENQIGLCLGDNRFGPVKGSQSGTLFTMVHDPLRILRQSSKGYVLSNAAGEKQYYEATPGQENHWRLVRSTDPFGNSIHYEYSVHKSWPVKITYGSENSTVSQRRTVVFDITEGGKQLPTRIRSLLGNKTVKDYRLESNSHSELVRIRECAPDTKNNCRILYQFDWITAGNPKPVLHTATNELGGTINVDYLPGSFGAVVAGYQFSDNSRTINKTELRYRGFKKDKKGRIRGFEEQAMLNRTTGEGVITRFGNGLQQDQILSTTHIILDGKEFSFDQAKAGITTHNRYKTIKNGYGISSLLVGQTQTFTDEKGESHTLDTIAFEFDPAGRRISRSSKDRKTVYTYKENETYPALLESKTVVETETGATIETSSWDYEFDGKKLKTVTINADILNDNSPATSAIYQLDQIGNISTVTQGSKTTRISYENDFPSLPSRVTWTSKEGDNNWLALKYDPSTGALIKSTNSLGLEISNKLDAFGNLLKETRKIPLPAEKDGPAFLFEINERTEEHIADGRLLVTETRSTRTGIDTAASSTLRQRTLYDGGGRVLLQETTLPTDSGETGTFTTKKRYSTTTISTRFIQPDGNWIENERDQHNRLIRQEDPIRGTIRYSYTQNGLISSINRNGAMITMIYDALDRLKEKRLPEGGKYTYFYADKNGEEPNRVILPGGQEISREFYSDGSQRSHKVSLQGPDDKVYHFETLFTYKNGAIETITYPDGSKLDYDYTDNFLTAIRWSKKAPSPWTDKDPFVARFNSSIDQQNNLYLKRFFQNGIVDSRKWSARGEIEKITVTDRLNKKLLAMGFNRNDDGLVTAVSRSQDGKSLNRNFEYSEQSRLISTSSTLDGENTTETFSYNDVGTLLSDNNGLRQYGIENTQNYRLLTRSDGLKITHDKNGNIISKQFGNTISKYEFNALNLLENAVVEKNGQAITTRMAYDERGERLIKQIEDGETTAYINPLYEITWTKDGRVRQTKYIPDPITTIASVTETLSAKDLLQMVPASSNTQTYGGTGPTIPQSTVFQDILAKGKLWISSFVPHQIVGFVEPALLGLTVFILLLLFEKTVRMKARRENFVDEMEFSSISASQETFHNPRRRFVTGVSSIAIVSFLFSLLSPSVHAALQKGESIPELSSVNFYHQTGNQSIILVTDQDGVISSSMDYNAYGTLNRSSFVSGKDVSRKKFAGMEYDASLGLYYNHARYYDPDLRRFISPDPANAGIDPYNYTEGNPVNYHDPDGRMPRQNGIDALYDKGNYGSNPDQMSSYRKLLLYFQRSLGLEEKIRQEKEEARNRERERRRQSVSNEIQAVPPSHITPFWRWKTVSKTSQRLEDADPAVSEDGATDRQRETGERPDELEISRSTSSQEDHQRRNPHALDVYYDENLILSHIRDFAYNHPSADDLTGLRRGVYQAVHNDPHLSITNEVDRQNSLARRNVESLSSMGAFLLALFVGAGLQAFYWPYYNVYDTSDDPEKAGFWKELVIVMGIILTFSGVSKLYYHLEGAYWNNFLVKKKFETSGQLWDENRMTAERSQQNTASWLDYTKFSARRMFWSVLTQMIFFNLFGVAAHDLRFGSFPTGTQVKNLNFGYILTSGLGNLMWLPLSMMLRNPSDDSKRAARALKARQLGFDNPEEVSSSVWSKFTHRYRRFLGRHGKFARGNYAKAQYLLRSLQFYVQYNMANTAFYMGYYIAVLTDPDLDGRWWNYVYKANLVRANLAVNSGLVSYLPRLLDLIIFRDSRKRFFTRSYTLPFGQRRSPGNPRSRLNPLHYFSNLGEVTLFNYRDTQSMQPVLWESARRSLEVKRLQEILMTYSEDASVQRLLSETTLFGTTDLESHIASRTYQEVRISISTEPEEEEKEDILQPLEIEEEQDD